ncbi:hypothetical protein [Vagococcus intermedius]|uniref:Uncharacterized protein n=1 Tax=Vagococcus intermedius TaxID=2991418 RepID=A0AAF0CT53_9ENTE|nr:hypothetical protein [Vagococcus intermedius]WEG72470.1 hypothetical protein OL234_05645 [Vagococcus intermedius]WEG74557.1 hypothetical protein OL235_05650 [Vagococcus intermedius]
MNKKILATIVLLFLVLAGIAYLKTETSFLGEKKEVSQESKPKQKKKEPKQKQPQPQEEKKEPKSTDETWKPLFEQNLYNMYQVTVQKYVFAGNFNDHDYYGIYVNELETGVKPYVTVDAETGSFSLVTD